MHDLSVDGTREFGKDLVEWLGHVSTGGCDARAATESLIPCLDRILAPGGGLMQVACTGSVDQVWKTTMWMTLSICFT